MNHLAGETSLYLRDHANQPVDWYPWAEKAWNCARQEDKPIFLSIGFSSCHWCHVMAREYFEDPDIARILNDNFVCIKVDREERPDIDEIYLEAVRLLTSSAGWPLFVFLTPELKPFYGGTYFPSRPNHGQSGFKRLLDSVLHYFRTERSEIEMAGNTIVQELERLSQLPTHEGNLGPKPLQKFYAQRLGVFDPGFGGFDTVPKFPRATDLILLLRFACRPGYNRALSMAETTLKKMAQGGIFDQLGGGFHRYSTDTIWLIPHFEKMLYDNVLLAQAYIQAFQVTKDEFYRSVAEQTLSYLVREMRSPEGGFYASQDADIENQEGEFYLWAKPEVGRLLGPELSPLACNFYGVAEYGIFRGRNILHTPMTAEKFLKHYQLDSNQFWQSLTEIKAKLKAARDRRVCPRRDEKILADWNGLALSAFARAYQAFGTKEYIKLAQDLADFITGQLTVEGTLLHMQRHGQSDLAGRLTDYAFVVQGLLDMYESGFDTRHLESARRLTDRMIALFSDPDGGFYTVPADAPGFITRAMSGFDGAIPSGNSVAVYNLLRLARLTGSNEYERIGANTIRRFYETMVSYPNAFAKMLSALDYLLHPGTELVLFIPECSGKEPDFLELLKSYPDPYRTTVLIRAAKPDQTTAGLVPSVSDRSAIHGKPTAYLYRNAVSLSVVQKINELEKILKSERNTNGLLDTDIGSE